VKGPVQPCVTAGHEISFSVCGCRLYC